MKKNDYEAPEAEIMQINLNAVICASGGYVPIGGGEGSTETPDEP